MELADLREFYGKEADKDIGLWMFAWKDVMSL